MNYEFLQQLLKHAESFEKEQSDKELHTIHNFGMWLQTKSLEEKNEDDIKKAFELTPNETIASSVSAMVVYLYRYAKGYTKKALANTPLITLDDFIYLATLLGRPGLSKMELISQNIQEKASGMEIIKRLLTNNLIYQEDDKNDKRSKRLYMTDLGHSVLFQAFVPMHSVAEQVCGNLSEGERIQLLTLLHKVEHFHRDLFEVNRRFEITLAE